MNKYRTMKDGYIQRQSDLALIPCVDGNADYAQYLIDAESGAEVLPYDYEAEEARQAQEKEKSAKETRKQEIKTLLRELDIKAIRPLLDNEANRVEGIKEKKITLRTELNLLN